jgi:hypothetical protein
VIDDEDEDEDGRKKRILLMLESKVSLKLIRVVGESTSKMRKKGKKMERGGGEG